jgi:DNA repair protein RecO (recombination protein O)
MERSISTDAVVIRRERSGEFHKGLTLLTADLGLVRATAYGAYKMQSRLRMASEPFTACRAQLYHNPVSHTHKVTELEVKESFPHLQAELPRIATASLWVEVILKSYGAGELSDHLYRLFLGCLRLLDVVDRRGVQYVSLQFLWRFLGLLGSRPDPSRCDSCGRLLPESAPVFYNPRANSMACEACSLPGLPRIPAGGRRYLEASASLPLAAAAGLRVEPSCLASLGRAVLAVTQAVLEGELATARYLAGAAQ